MGFGKRVYAFGPDGKVRRLAVRAFDRLYEGAKDNPIVEYAGKRIKMAMVFVGTQNRRSIGLRHVDYFIVYFDSKGFIDQDENWEEMQLAANSNPFASPGSTDILEQLRPSLYRLKYRDKFTWSPTSQDKELIESLALK